MSDTANVPAYVVHEVTEDEVTVDWFFGSDRATGRVGTRLVQLVLILVGWFFAILPIVITASALIHRDDPNRGWWGYHEGFEMWDRTIAFLGILVVLFAIGYLVLHLVDRSSARRRDRQITYDEQRLAARLDVAENMYASKYGPAELRRTLRRVTIEPYGAIETYELRGLYRDFEDVR